MGATAVFDKTLMKIKGFYGGSSRARGVANDIWKSANFRSGGFALQASVGAAAGAGAEYAAGGDGRDMVKGGLMGAGAMAAWRGGRATWKNQAVRNLGSDIKFAGMGFKGQTMRNAEFRSAGMAGPTYSPAQRARDFFGASSDVRQAFM